MHLKFSQLKPIIKELRLRGYKKNFVGDYTKVFSFSDVPNLKRSFTVSVLELALYHDGHNALLDSIHATCMDELAEEETKQRFKN